MNREERQRLMATAPIPSLIMKMAIPTIISTLVMSLYNMADTYFVSGLGTAATSAVGINLSLMNFISMFGMPLALGANSYIARLLGQKRQDKVEEVLSFSFFSALAIGIVLMLLGLVFLGPIMSILGAKGEVVNLASDYAIPILLASPAIMGVYILNQTLRSEGSAGLSMIGMLSGVALNLLLDPLLIYSLNLGVSGAAIATAISKVASFFVLFLPYVQKKTLVHLSIKNYRVKKDTLVELLKMGFPTFARTALTTLAMTILNNVASSMGNSILAAVTVSNRIMFFLSSAVLGFAQGYQPVVGFNWGAGDRERVNKAFWYAIKASIISTVILSTLTFIFATNLMGAFTNNDVEFMEFGVKTLRIQCIVMPSVALVIVVNMTYAGMGFAVGASLLSIVRQGIFFIPAILTLPTLFGKTGLACVQGVADFFSLLFCIPFILYILKKINGKV